MRPKQGNALWPIVVRPKKINLKPSPTVGRPYSNIKIVSTLVEEGTQG